MILNDVNTNAIAIGISCAVGAIVLIILGFVFYKLVISKNYYKKQIKELERKFNYLDALLKTQDGQYIHRLEIISRSNLLYVEKYEYFQIRFKDILENDDRFADGLIKTLQNQTASNQYKNIKLVIADARKAVSTFEERVNNLDEELYNVIKIEEECRTTILQLREHYRQVKQDYNSKANELEFVSSTFTLVFEKLDSLFVANEALIESASYEESKAQTPKIVSIIDALEKVLVYLPDLVSLITKVVPNKIKELEARYNEVEQLGLPLFHLNFKTRVDSFNQILKEKENSLKQLKTSGVKEEADNILEDINGIYKSLDEELQAKEEFISKCDEVYENAADAEKSFMKICSYLQNIKKVYLISEAHNQQIESLRSDINSLSQSKRNLDGFVHSGTHQPYSLLKRKLDDLRVDYDKANKGIIEFNAYIESLKVSAEEAYNLEFSYFYHTKETEALLRNFGIDHIKEYYSSSIEDIYSILNDINSIITKQPIDVETINLKVEQLKNIANPLYDEIEERARAQKLAESAVVYANRDRFQQSDVHHQLSILEGLFFSGDFDKVYHDANAIFRNSHVEEQNARN